MTSPTSGPAASGASTAPPGRPRWLAPAALLIGIGIGAAVVAALPDRGDDASRTSPTEQASELRVADVQASCHDWMGSSPTARDTDDQWCSDMFEWMDDQPGGAMMGSMMWSGPEQMGASCRSWVSRQGAPAADLGQQRCSDMVEWMDTHMTSRRGTWMMHDR